MRIHFNGAAKSVTGSQYLLEVNGNRILLECGLFQGRRRDSYERNRNFSFPPKSITAVLLSHAHIDHSGNLPNLVKQEYSGPIYATPATADLADIMLQDSGHIQEADTVFINKRHAERGEPPVESLYTLEDATKVAQYFQPKKLNEVFEVAEGVTAQFVEAGHILGSAAIRLEVQEKGRLLRFWFSGDIGRRDLPILQDPVLPFDADYIMMECTYGDKPHRNPAEAHFEFQNAVLKTVRRGGKVIIPAFAVGRTQELVYSLNMMRVAGKLRNVPVYVDSPLAMKATKIFEGHPECYDEQTNQFIRIGKHPALQFDGLTYIRSVDESKALNERGEPMVIISASGMAEAGRIRHHIKNNIEDPRNLIMIVGWQAPDTLGRRLAEQDKEVKIFGDIYQRRAEVVTIGGLSAHAGQDLLVKYALACKKTLKSLILVHGEKDAISSFEERLRENGITRFTYPDLYTNLVI